MVGPFVITGAVMGLRVGAGVGFLVTGMDGDDGVGEGVGGGVADGT